MTLRAAALPVARRRAIRATLILCGLFVALTNSVAQSAELSMGLGGAVNPAISWNHPVLEPSPRGLDTAPPDVRGPGFFRTNRFLLPSYLLLTGVDAWATNRGFTSCPVWHENNPLIPGAPGARAAYFASTAAGVIGTGWLLHKTGHTKLSKWLMRVAAGTEAQGAVYTTITSGQCAR